MCMWIKAEAGWLASVMYSLFSRTARIAKMLVCRSARIEGVLVRMLIPSEAVVASMAGMAAEKTNEVPLMRWEEVSLIQIHGEEEIKLT